MNTPQVVSQEEWITARKQFLKKEKEFTRLRDELNAKRRELPWFKIEKDYVFEDAQGKQSLADLFNGNSQLIIYHFMYGPEWEQPCPSCSFWADNFNDISIHLAHRDISFMAVSRADFATLDACKKRMDWSFQWMSSRHSDFNYEFAVSFSEQQKADNKITYNYLEQPYFIDELPGISVFYKNADGEIFHTYSTYARGLDMLNGAYHYIDLAPKGRDEDSGMSWVRRHDEYE